MQMNKDHVITIDSKHKEEVLNWIKRYLGIGNYEFISIKWNNCNIAKETTEKFTRTILRNLFRECNGRHWFKRKLMKGIIVSELGKNKVWHVHMVLNIGVLVHEELLQIFEKMMCKCWYRYNIGYRDRYGNKVLPHIHKDTIFMERVYSDYVINYVLKEIQFKSKKINFDNLTPIAVMINKS